MKLAHPIARPSLRLSILPQKKGGWRSTMLGQKTLRASSGPDSPTAGESDRENGRAPRDIERPPSPVPSASSEEESTTRLGGAESTEGAPPSLEEVVKGEVGPGRPESVNEQGKATRGPGGGLEDTEQVPSLEWVGVEEPGRQEQEKMTPSGLVSPAAQPTSAPRGRQGEAGAEGDQGEAPWSSMAAGQAQAQAQDKGILSAEKMTGPEFLDRYPKQLSGRPLPRSMEDVRVPSPAEESSLKSVDMSGPAELAKSGVDPQEELYEKDVRRALNFVGLLAFSSITVYSSIEIFKAVENALPSSPGEALSVTSRALLRWLQKPKGPGESLLGLATAATAFGASLYFINVAERKGKEFGQRVRRQLILLSRYALFAGVLVLMVYLITRE